MTSMPDAVAAPPRPAPSQRGGSAGDDSRDGDFSSLVDDTAEEEPDEAATRPDRLRRRNKPTPHSTAAAQSAITQAVVQPSVQPGGSTDAPLMPWMVAASPAAPSPAISPAPAPNPAGTAAPTGQQAVSAAGNGNRTAGSAAAPQQPAEPAATGVPPPAGTTQTASAAGDAPQGSPQNAVGLSAAETAFPQSTPVPTEATAATSAMGAPTAAPDAAPDGRASRRDESSDPRTAVRSTRGPGRPAAAGKADQPIAAAPAPRTAQPAAGAAATAATPEPAPAFGTPPSANGATAATGFEALPTLPAQAATQYAAAAASGRATVAHSPAMAQLAVPLVRVLESGGGEFHIDLAPAELGRIRVVADVSDGKVSLTVQAEQADTLALLRRDLQQLERALGDAGLSLDNASLQFSLQDDGQSRGFAAPDQGRAAAGWRAQAQPDASPEPVADRPMRLIDGLVDVTV